MTDAPRLLVVDDEEAICEGCRRIFSRQGFLVEKCCSASDGLNLAAKNQYDAILLDIKMPGIDGIEFLEQLRTKRPSVPVVLMTGYPSVPNAVSAIRLGAAGFVTKPFTPEEISQAVLRHLDRPAGELSAADESQAVGPEGIHFWQEAWLARGHEGSVRVGAVLPCSGKSVVEKLLLPRIGEVVYQGLPLAGVVMGGHSPLTIPSPLSGVVVGVNELLSRNPSLLVSDACGSGWMATVAPTRLEEEIARCRRRNVFLWNDDNTSAAWQRRRLESLGCSVRRVASVDEVLAGLREDGCSVLVMQASASASEGPELVGRINLEAPGLKIVLVASADTRLEAAYRARRIFYYALEPFADNEIAEILDAAFRPRTAAVAAAAKKALGRPLASLLIGNRQGKRIRLVAEPGLLRREEGLGAQIRMKLLDGLFPLETTAGDARIDPADLLRQAASCDRLVVLMARDAGRLPGSLVRDTQSQFVAISGKANAKVTTLVIQPDLAAEGSTEFDARTTTMLAEHIVNDIASY